jgi:putative hemolysin
VLGHLVPKALAQQYPERILCRFSGLVTLLARPGETIQAGLVASSTVVLRLFGQTHLPAFTPLPVITEEDVTTLIREGAERGIFEIVEHELIAGVFEFTDTAAREIMVPRVDIKALEATIPPDEVIRKLIETGHTRVPVYRGDLDHIVGILSLKDVLRAVDEGRPWEVRDLLHPPLYVPETAQISRLLRTLQQRRLNMAIVVDEHGGVAGLVTIEDLVEQLVGDIQDEGEPIGEALVTQLPDGALVIQGRTPLWELRESFGLPVEETSDYQTLAGFLLARLGHIPHGGESIIEADYTFTVVDMDGPRIARVKVERRVAEGTTELAAEPLPREQTP